MFLQIRGPRALTAALALIAPLVAGLLPASAAAGSAVYEAENATISQGAVASDHPGYTGTGFVDYTNVAGGYIQWTVAATSAGRRTLTLRYANGTGSDRPLTVSVNGTAVATSLSFPGTGGWDAWATRQVTADLAAGTNVVRATATGSSGGPNVDSLTVADGAPATDWSTAVVESTMARYTPSTIGGWSYPVGLYLYGQYLVYQRTHDPRYLQYIKDWAGRFVDADGNIGQSFGSLDSMQAGNILLVLYKETGQSRWRVAAQKIRTRLNSYPRTSDRGWWHADNDSRQGQLWGDGVFMVDPFVIRYGHLLGDAAWGDDNAAEQLAVYARHLQRTTGPQAGLLWHAYDEPGGLTASWVHPELGNTNGITWCRAEGWYGMAITDILELLPADHPRRAALIDITRKLVAAFAAYQDPATGRWWQVVDRQGASGNWLETSCSAMYTTTISRAVERGYVDPGYQVYADRGYRGVLAEVSLGSDGRTNIRDICVGTNASDSLDFYYGRQRATNDNHGLGAFLIMNEQMIKTGRA
ncbi:hypothetical protein GCM10009530_52950 [Microbispora corallina]|uniref:CBM6 domain-containing protein n=1 Tax=Microbispora corallina TaxID=83302 RepID=A0ABQ4G356_9ACTN|nr:glycoside hydrolase family 88 protein [Microbispora corallina]GIH41470.1 hypothetical protein Mco01_44700 [Microbispora corallina]